MCKSVGNRNWSNDECFFLISNPYVDFFLTDVRQEILGIKFDGELLNRNIMGCLHETRFSVQVSSRQSMRNSSVALSRVNGPLLYIIDYINTEVAYSTRRRLTYLFKKKATCL